MWLTLEMAVRYLLYVIVFVIFWLLLVPVFFQNRFRRGIRRIPRWKPELSQEPVWARHIRKMLTVTLQLRSLRAVLTFYLISVLLMVMTFLFCWELGLRPSFVTGAAIFFGTLPYLLLRIRLYAIRIGSSYEGDVLVTELISQYKINYLNMVEAIDATIPRLPPDLLTRKALMRLSMQLKENGGQEDVNEAIMEFTYAINTNWANLLGTNLYLAIVDQDQVIESLEDILDELVNLRKLNEAGKQENAEAYFMIVYFVPLLFVASIVSMFVFMNMPLAQWIDYQFKHPLGLQSFILCIILLFANGALYLYTKNRKTTFKIDIAEEGGVLKIGCADRLLLFCSPSAAIWILALPVSTRAIHGQAYCIAGPAVQADKIRALFPNERSDAERKFCQIRP
ncbi:hypothetical protein [Paenibacillus senegalensis]|nr:hypothetical protein [Paenibacillus senegalensis]